MLHLGLADRGACEYVWSIGGEYISHLAQSTRQSVNLSIFRGVIVLHSRGWAVTQSMHCLYMYMNRDQIHMYAHCMYNVLEQLPIVNFTPLMPVPSHTQYVSEGLNKETSPWLDMTELCAFRVDGLTFPFFFFFFSLLLLWPCEQISTVLFCFSFSFYG